MLVRLQINVLIGWIFAANRACYYHYVKPTHTLYLYDLVSGVDTWLPLDLNGTQVSVESPHCKIYRQNTTVNTSGNMMQLTADVEFKPVLGAPAPEGMGTPLHIFAWTRDHNGDAYGWNHVSFYRPTNIGGISSLSAQIPPGGSSRRAVMRFRASDPDGAWNLFQLNALLNPVLWGYTTGCYLHYVTMFNTLYLYQPATATWSPMSLDQGGGPASLDGPYCVLRREGTYAAALNATTFELGVDVEFKTNVNGNVQIQTWARDMAMMELGWNLVGTYMLP